MRSVLVVLESSWGDLQTPGGPVVVGRRKSGAVVQNSNTAAVSSLTGDWRRLRRLLGLKPVGLASFLRALSNHVIIFHF